MRGYKEKGNINTPLELAILNQVDRFNLAIDVIDRVPGLQASAAHIKGWLKDQIIESINYAHTEGIDKPEITNWTWPERKARRHATRNPRHLDRTLKAVILSRRRRTSVFCWARTN